MGVKYIDMKVNNQPLYFLLCPKCHLIGAFLWTKKPSKVHECWVCSAQIEEPIDPKPKHYVTLYLP